MTTAELPAAAPAIVLDGDIVPSDGAVTRRHIRGSSLLLVGRMLSLLINLATQVLLARYLAKEDFGAFAYALAAAALGASVVSLGLDKSARRFVPIFHEQGDTRRLVGTILLASGAIVALGLLLVVTLFALRGVIANRVVTDELSLSLTLILIALAPVEALNRLCIGLVATFAGARAIFLRQHVIGPALKLAIVIALAVFYNNVYLLAAGYLAAGLFGTAFYVAYLVHVLRKLGLWRQFLTQKSIVPARDVLSYSLPLLSSDVANVGRAFLAVYFLGLFHGPAVVAAFRAVVPLAGLNKIVFETFQFLFMPLASRLYARGDRAGIDHLYWRTSLWITVLTYPLFLVTFATAEPLTVLVLGPQYREAGSVLAWLSLGFFFNAALGFNTLTLKVFGDVRQIVQNDVLATIVTVALYAALVPQLGAVGAAIANCAALVFHNVVNQIALVRMAGITFFPAAHQKLYAVMIFAATALAAIQWTWAPPLFVALLIAAAISASILVLARHVLEVDEMFPELARLPLVRQLLSSEVAA